MFGVPIYRKFQFSRAKRFFSSAILEIEFAIIYSMFYEVCGGLQTFFYWIVSFLFVLI